MKARILKDDVSNRFQKGETGTVLNNTFEKYDYFLALEPTYIPEEQRTGFLKNIEWLPRKFYFYKEEISIVIE